MSKQSQITEWLDEMSLLYEDLPTMDGYDRNAVIEKLMDDDSMSYEDAVEFHEFNQSDAYVGPNTPAFLIPVGDL